MSSIFLSPEVSIELFVEFLLLSILSFAFVKSLLLLKSYTTDVNPEIQVIFDKKIYLISTLVQVSLVLKLSLIIFFIYTLDELALVIPGAMCVSGVLGANEYGSVLLILKIFVVLVSALFLVVKKNNFKKRMRFFMILYFLILIEFILSFTYFSSISVETTVSCCSTKYKHFENMIPFDLSKTQLLGLFYALYIAVLISAYKKYKVFLLLSVSLFTYISYYAIVYYFAAFIYGDSIHICPFCMLKEKYNFIGYFIYSTLFMSIFYTFSFVLFSYMENVYKKIIISFSLFVLLLLSSYLIANSL